MGYWATISPKISATRNWPQPATKNAQIIGGPPSAIAMPKRVYVPTTGER